MKIFSLQSKISLTFWSVGLGVVIDLAAFIKSKFVWLPIGGCLNWAETRFYCTDFFAQYGWPIRLETKLQASQVPILAFLYNGIFWISVSFIILFIVRHFRKKSVKITTNL
jgi:hypothetical protein